MMIYVIPKGDDKPIKIVFEGEEESDSIVEDDQVYLIDEHPSPKENGEALKTLCDRLISESTLVDDHTCPDKAPSPEEIEDFFISLNEMLMAMEEEDMEY